MEYVPIVTISMKQTLRENLIKQRNALTNQQQKNLSGQIISNLAGQMFLKKAQNIAIYLPVNSEADPGKIKDLPGYTHTQFFLPILSKNPEQGLQFAPLNNDSQLKLNRFSIPEPICSENELRTGRELDLVIVPLVGFDKRGNRLGMGGGFYDRCFSFKNKTHVSRPILVGFAYALQEVPDLEVENWDVKLDYIATENNVFAC